MAKFSVDKCVHLTEVYRTREKRMPKISKLEVLEKEFREWRKSRSSVGEKIPDKLIRGAMKLEKSGEFGKTLLLRRLRLSFNDYEHKKNALSAEAGPKFVKSVLPQLVAVNKEQKIEVQIGTISGHQIKLFCSAGAEESLARLVRNIALGAESCSK